MAFFWVALGSALGGMLRYGFSRWTGSWNHGLPWTTIAINVLGSFVIGYFGTLTQPGTRFAAGADTRLFVMVGICGGFTTFSSFSLETFDLLRTGATGRALVNAGLSVGLCLAAVGLGHRLAQVAAPVEAVVESAEEKLAA